MKALLLLQKAQQLGLKLLLKNGELCFRGSRKAASGELLRAISEKKEELIALLKNEASGCADATTADPLAPAHDRYAEAVADVARAWDAMKATGREPPWMDASVERELDERIADRFRVGDLQGALRGIETWKRAWHDLLASPTPLDASTGPPPALEATVRRLDAARLFDLADDPDVPEADRKVYRAEVLRRADSMVEEAEGRRSHPNQAVHNMFDRHTGGMVNCREHRHWISTTGARVCGICHPPADPGLVARWLEEE